MVGPIFYMSHPALNLRSVMENDGRVGKLFTWSISLLAFTFPRVSHAACKKTFDFTSYFQNFETSKDPQEWDHMKGLFIVNKYRLKPFSTLFSLLVKIYFDRDQFVETNLGNQVNQNFYGNFNSCILAWLKNEH